MAWYLRSRPPLAEPPADSPSTMNSSHRAGSRSWQSASFPGRPPESMADLRRVSSRALRAASRARAASMHLPTMRRATVVCLSKYSPRRSLMSCSTGPLMSLLSFPLVWPSNCGCGNFTETTATSPSRTSSPVMVTSSFCSLSMFEDGSEIVDRARQRRAEAGKVRPAVHRVDRVGEGKNIFRVAVVVLQRDFDFDRVFLAFHVNGRIVEHLSCPCSGA